MVSIKQIAEQLQVSTATVSYALRGRPGVSEATREKVLAVSKELGYRADPMNSALAESRWRGRARDAAVSIAVLLGHKGKASPHASDPVPLIRNYAELSGYFLHPVMLREIPSASVFNRRLDSLSVRGVIIDSIAPNQTHALQLLGDPELDWSQRVWVACNENAFAPPCNRVLFNSFAAVQTALSQIFDYGYKRIAFIREPDDLSQENRRQHGSFLQFKATNRTVQLIDLTIEPKQPLAAPALARLRAFRPDALLQGYQHMRSLLPEDIQRLPWASLGLWDGLSDVAGISLALDDLARCTLDLLDFQFRRRDFGLPKLRHTMLVDNHWVEGATLPRASSK